MTFASGLLQQGAKLIIGLVVTPIIIRGLGQELYGVWLMIKQSTGYTAQADLRPMATLKFTLGVRQHEHDFHQKRRQIGAAILIWGLTLPIIFTLGAGLLWTAYYNYIRFHSLKFVLFVYKSFYNLFVLIREIRG